jgi:hypothetical protein
LRHPADAVTNAVHPAPLDAALTTSSHYLAALPKVGDHLQVRLIPFITNVGLAPADRESLDGVIAVDLYAHRPSANEPPLTITAERGHWYVHLSTEFDSIWAYYPLRSPACRSGSATLAERM